METGIRNSSRRRSEPTVSRAFLSSVIFIVVHNGPLSAHSV